MEFWDENDDGSLPTWYPKRKRPPKKSTKGKNATIKTFGPVKKRIFLKTLYETGSARSAALAAFPSLTPSQASRVGKQMVAGLKDTIINHLDLVGLDDYTLAQEIMHLVEGKRTQFFSHQGVVVDEREVTDLTAKKAGVELALKVKGHMVDKSNVTVEVPTVFVNNTVPRPKIKDINQADLNEKAKSKSRGKPE